MSFPLANYAAKALPQAQLSLGFASISSSYTQIGSTTFLKSPILVLIYSSFNADVQFSFDGVVDFIPIPAGGTLAIDLKTNDAPMPMGYGAYVKSIGMAPISGSIYVGYIGVN